jgi:hypothetical protein
MFSAFNVAAVVAVFVVLGLGLWLGIASYRFDQNARGWLQVCDGLRHDLVTWDTYQNGKPKGVIQRLEALETCTAYLITERDDLAKRLHNCEEHFKAIHGWIERVEANAVAVSEHAHELQASFDLLAKQMNELGYKTATHLDFLNGLEERSRRAKEAHALLASQMTKEIERFDARIFDLAPYLGAIGDQAGELTRFAARLRTAVDATVEHLGQPHRLKDKP